MNQMTARESSNVISPRRFEKARNKKLALTSLRWVGRSLDHQQEEIGEFRGNISELRHAMDDLAESCGEYLAAQDRLKFKVKRLRGKSLRLAGIAGGWA